MASRIRLHITGAFFAILLLASIGPAAGNLWASLSPQGNDQDPPDIEPLSVDPPDPYNFDVVASEQTSLDLSWDGQQTGIVFELQRGTTTLESSWGQETYTDTGLGCGTSYNYKVRSWGDGSQPWNHNSSNWVTTSGTTDSAAAAFSSSSYTATEGSSTTITVNLDCNIGKDVIIPVTVTPGTNRSVSISKGNSSGTFSFSPSDDNSDCNDETINLGFGNLPSGVTAGSPASATVSVSDDDSPTVRFSPSSYTVTEGGSSTSVTLSLNCAPGQNVSIPVTGNDGTSESVSIGSSSTSGSFDFSASADGGCTGRTVTLSFGTLPDAVSADSQEEATVNVLDPDRPAVSFGASTYTVDEGESTPGTVNMSCSVDYDENIYVTVSTGGYLTASVDSGYDSGVFNIYGSHDFDCDNEEVDLSFSSLLLPSGWTQGSPNKADVTVWDDDSPQAYFRRSIYEVREGGNVDITVDLTCDHTADVTIPVQVGPPIYNRYIGISSGGTSGSFNYVPYHDNLDCNDEELDLTLVNPPPAGIDYKFPSSATIAIEDDEVCLNAPDLSVFPRPGREAFLHWPRDPNSDGATIRVREPIKAGAASEIWNYWTNVGSSMTCPVPSYCGIYVNLDDITYGRGLADASLYEFRVKLTDSTGSYLESPEVHVLIEDTRIVSVNGYSPGAGAREGKAYIKLTPYDSATSHAIRWRKLGNDSGSRSHSDPMWRLDDDSLPLTFEADETIPGTSHYTVGPTNQGNDGLELEAIYAMQAYHIREQLCDVEQCYVKAFAARDMFVWPSDRSPGGGERVGSFPLLQILPTTHSYVFCEQTFLTGRRDDWKKFIHHAFGQWEVATENLVRARLLANTDCSDYSEFVDEIIVDLAAWEQSQGGQVRLSDARDHAQWLISQFQMQRLQSTRNLDDRLNEVKMIRDDKLHPVAAIIFAEISKGVGPGFCDAEAAIACTNLLGVTDPNTGIISFTKDILLPYSRFAGINLDRPGADEITSKDDLPFGLCGTTSSLYGTLVHEAGHAFGIAFPDDSEDGHPSMPHVMMYGGHRVYLCSPTPMDVLAIFALYQKPP